MLSLPPLSLAAPDQRLGGLARASSRAAQDRRDLVLGDHRR